MKVILKVHLGVEAYNCLIMYTHSQILTKTPLANFLFSETEEVTIRIDSSISNINIVKIWYCSKLPIPILLKEFFRIIS